jgi:hypothetical protein
MSQKIERRIVVQEEVVRSSALASNRIWALDGITAEEDRLVHTSKPRGVERGRMY